MQVPEIIRRLTGFSTPFGGLSWAPATDSDKEAARRVLAFLEDRRVLYAPLNQEERMYCTRSVLEIRHLLTEEIGHLAAGNDLGFTLRAMRAQCRRFLDAVDGHSRRGHGHWDPFGEDSLNQSLGELRGVFGIHIAQLAIHYDIELEDELATIVPPEPDDADAEDGPGKSKRARRASDQD